MTGVARSQEVAFEIEPLLSEGKYKEARVLLCQCLDQNPLDRESRLYLLLVNVILNGPIAYEDDIDRLRDLLDLSNTEKEIIRRIFVLGFEAAEKDGREDQAWVYQRLLRRLLLAQALDQVIPKSVAHAFPANQVASSKPIENPSTPTRERYWNGQNNSALSPRRLIVTSKKMCLAFLNRCSGTLQTSWKTKTSSRAALVGATIAVIIQILYVLAIRSHTAKETPSHTRPAPQPQTVIDSVPAMRLIALPRDRNEAETLNTGVQNMVDAQLFSLRRAYGKWTQKDGNLMGSLLVKIQVDADGNVVKAEDLASRLTDTDFREVVLDEARKWKFPKVNGDAAEFTVPLLFVPQGMDPRTVVRWEQTLNSSDVETKAIPSLHIISSSISEQKREPSVNPDQRLANVKATKIIDASASKTKPPEDPPKSMIDYRTRRAAPLRQEPRFASATAEDIDPGTLISVLEARGDWLKVKTRSSGKVGYLRKEYVAPAGATQ